MTETVQIAIVTGAAAIAGGIVTHWFEGRRDADRARAENLRLAETFEDERRRRLETFIREVRTKQGDRMRDWIERQLVASIDMSYLDASAQIQGDPNAQMAARGAAMKILASRDAGDGRSPSINAALSGVTDRELVRLMRKLADYDVHFRAILQPFRDFLSANPVPWDATQLEQLWRLVDELREQQERFDDATVEVYAYIERYCAMLSSPSDDE